jgi:hypothetical protein
MGIKQLMTLICDEVPGSVSRILLKLAFSFFPFFSRQSCQANETLEKDPVLLAQLS